MNAHAPFFNYFDFDFCKIAFDGKKLSIFDFDSVVNRHCIFNISKYALPRNLQIGNALLEKANLVVRRRMEVYRKRGYTIIDATRFLSLKREKLKRSKSV